MFLYICVDISFIYLQFYLTVDTETEQLEGNETDAAQEISKEQKDDSPTSSTTDEHGKNTKGKTDTDIGRTGIVVICLYALCCC